MGEYLYDGLYSLENDDLLCVLYHEDLVLLREDLGELGDLLRV